MIKKIIIIYFLSFLAAGCITSSYNKSNEEYQHVMREFNTDSENNMKVFKGKWGGETDLQGEKYNLVQFQDILKGEKRYLNIYIPFNNQKEMIFTDSEFLIEGKRDAFLVFQIFSDMNQDFFYSLIHLKPGSLSDPLKILKTHLKYEVENPGYPFALIHLNFSNILTYSAQGVIWNKVPEEKNSSVGNSVIGYGNYDNPVLKIKWDVRSKGKYVLRQFGYVGTVLADIVTSPVQLVYFILMGFSGGVR